MICPIRYALTKIAHPSAIPATPARAKHADHHWTRSCSRYGAPRAASGGSGERDIPDSAVSHIASGGVELLSAIRARSVGYFTVT